MGDGAASSKGRKPDAAPKEAGAAKSGKTAPPFYARLTPGPRHATCQRAGKLEDARACPGPVKKQFGRIRAQDHSRCGLALDAGVPSPGVGCVAGIPDHRSLAGGLGG